LYIRLIIHLLTKSKTSWLNSIQNKYKYLNSIVINYFNYLRERNSQ
jgi:hypothetical protein